MLNILKENYFNEYYVNGFIDTGIFLTDELVEEMKTHYKNLAENRNDYPKYFVKNEHQAYMEGKLIGFLFTLLPELSKKMVKRLYSKAYSKAVHVEQVFIERICTHLLQHDFQKYFKTRYLIASYDIYLGNDNEHKSFTEIHSDVPNFHHFYETESDLTIYIPLIDLNEKNGGRLRILPENKSKLKVAGNVLLKLLEQHFSTDSSNLDENGYIDPEKITDKNLDLFKKSKPYKDLLDNYKTSTNLVRKYYADDFIKNDWQKGKAVLFTNKNFHAAESWKNEEQNREIYMLRLLPIYDTKIKLKGKLHGSVFNNYLIDTQEGHIYKYDQEVDVSQIPEYEKLKL